MKKLSESEAIKMVHKKLYNSSLKNIDKNLESLIRLKKYYIINQNKKKKED